MTPLRAISLYQPYASAFSDGLKTNETRGRPTRIRGDVVICAARRKPKPEEIWATGSRYLPETLPYGCALCIVEITDCISTAKLEDDCLTPISATESVLGDYSPGRFVWRTRNLRRLKTPVPVVGHQGFWFLTLAETEAVLAQTDLPKVT